MSRLLAPKMSVHHDDLNKDFATIYRDNLVSSNRLCNIEKTKFEIGQLVWSLESDWSFSLCNVQWPKVR